MQNVLICQITSMRKLSVKPCKIFLNFCQIFTKQFVWALDVDKFRKIIFNMAKTHELLMKKETSDVLSSKISLISLSSIFR